MQEIELNPETAPESAPPPKIKFWKRQFQTSSTGPQRVFDWILGVILPVICFVFDPVIFKANGLASPLFGWFTPFAYLLSFVSVMALAAWLIWGARLKWLNALLSGLFFAGAFASFCVAVVLFPFSVIGLFFFIGILGFTPFFCAFVYLRNGLRALQASKPFVEKPVLIYSVVFAALVSLVVPSVISLEIYKSLENIRTGDAQTVRDESLKLRVAAPLVDPGKLVFAYRTAREYTPDGAEKKRAIAELFREMTGKDLELELQNLVR